MRFNRSLPEAQALTSPAVPVATNGHPHAQAEAQLLERTAAELGTSPFWVRRGLRRHGLSIDAFVDRGLFKALKQKRAAPAQGSYANA